ncbi:hypothetical protein TNCV_886981 [Trichonephila clavipes]|uniref:Uncharacterized protein n=1 Tax=Trichonephila clavipes TaxID=2585209 RepID=A0A8X6RGH0_TRICX|nr:hypothetical protein TNCV_886981 [Trichonephila clavipes]
MHITRMLEFNVHWARTRNPKEEDPRRGNSEYVFDFRVVATVTYWSRQRARSRRVMSSSLVPLKTRLEEGPMSIKYVEAQTSSCWGGVEVRKEGGVPAQVSSSSSDHGSK